MYFFKVHGYMNKWKTIAILAIILMIISGGATYYIYMQSAKNLSASKVAQDTYFYTLEGDFITNLKDNDRYIKVNIELEISDKKLENELKMKNAIIRNEIISILRSQTTAQVAGSQGQMNLGNLILMKVNSILKTGKVLKVCFDNFIVQ